MPDFKHLFPTSTAAREQYTYAKQAGSVEFKLPPRDDRLGHGAALIRDVQTAQQQAASALQQSPPSEPPKGIVLEFCSAPGFQLRLKSLDDRTQGVELRSSRTVDGVMYGTVFVPKDKLGVFVRKFEEYQTRNTAKGQPLNRNLVESIDAVRLASIRSYWTDSEDYPKTDLIVWWEVWLQDSTNQSNVAQDFRNRAQKAGVVTGDRELKFPERRVLLAKGTLNDLVRIENLFDILAELRLAKKLAGEFLELPPRDQAALVRQAVERIRPPAEDAPAVCHLDTGVNRGHPLLEFAVHQDHVVAVEPDWHPADRRGHGTEMAGLALYGCLTKVLGNDSFVVLQHRIESVKILSDIDATDPDLYGEVTAQAASTIEIIAPSRSQRVFCLTVTANSNDDGYPSSWSAALDQICASAGQIGRSGRLVIVSAGNIPLVDRRDYPDSNARSSIEDPAQSWNALTVGACTQLSTIYQPGYERWRPVAEPGRLSPCSRTSAGWEDQSWAIKPDIVMEGGNSAIDPASKHADFVDDLSLLTTRVSPTGALLTTTADTSASTALAARCAAMIWAQYPALWPESVRGLMVHSARWTPAMLKEFPFDQRHSRLRSYGYGIPDLQRALWSASNAATLIIQDALTPFDKAQGESVKTKDMHLHRLPWPVSVLEDLGELPVQMRVTLSYFIEPSPGRRGWTDRHRFQSHGLRFDVKRPTETEAAFHKRNSRAAWDDDDNVKQGTDGRKWELGSKLRSKGSIHSDTWIGTAVELANSGMIAIFPVTGWWRERPHLNRWNSKARYSLIVSIETEATDVDLYTPIETLVKAAVEVPVIWDEQVDQ